jgi:hypothetical protein
MLRALTFYPGGRKKKYCVIDELSTYRILKAYGKLPVLAGADWAAFHIMVRSVNSLCGG